MGFAFKTVEFFILVTLLSIGVVRGASIHIVEGPVYDFGTL